MPILLVLVPVLAALSALFLYQHNGKRQLLNFDIVQFVYSFVLVPVLFIWLKSFLYFIVRTELGSSLSYSQFFLIDTVFSVIFLFIGAFVVIHSLTKSFELQRKKDPLVDLFELSEYFHLTLSHFVIFVGILLLTALLSIVNLLMPITVVAVADKPYVGLFLGILAGIAFQLSVFKYEPSRQFFRVLKLIYGSTFLFFVITYFLLNPRFSSIYGFYWTFFTASVTLIIMGVFAEPASEENPWWKPFTLNYRKGVSIVNSLKLARNIFNK